MDEGRPYFACQSALTVGSDEVGQTVTMVGRQQASDMVRSLGVQVVSWRDGPGPEYGAS